MRKNAGKSEIKSDPQKFSRLRRRFFFQDPKYLQLISEKFDKNVKEENFDMKMCKTEKKYAQ